MARCLRVPTIYGTSTGATPNKRTRAYLPYSLVAVYRMDCTDSTRLNSTLLVVESFLQDNEPPTPSLVPHPAFLGVVTCPALPYPAIPPKRLPQCNPMDAQCSPMDAQCNGWMDGWISPIPSTLTATPDGCQCHWQAMHINELLNYSNRSFQSIVAC